MTIPNHHKENFQILLRAAEAHDLALVECADTATGEPRYVLCAVTQEDGTYVLTPFGHLVDGDPYSVYTPPTS